MVKKLTTALFAFLFASCSPPPVDPFDRAIELEMQGLYAEAIAVLDTLIAADSTHIAAWVSRGNNKIQLRDYPGALDDLKAAARIRSQKYGFMQVELMGRLNDPKDVPLDELYFSRGVAYFYADSINQAYSDLSFCIKHNYSMQESLYWRGCTYWKAGMKTEAYFDFVNVIRLSAEDDEYAISAQKYLDLLGANKPKE